MDTSAHHISPKKLTNRQRQAIFEALLKQSQNGKLKRGCISEVAANVKTVHQIWLQAITIIAN